MSTTPLLTVGVSQAKEQLEMCSQKRDSECLANTEKKIGSQ